MDLKFGGQSVHGFARILTSMLESYATLSSALARSRSLSLSLSLCLSVSLSLCLSVSLSLSLSRCP